MDSKAIYKLADEMTEQQVENTVTAWEINGEKEKTRKYNALVRLGDSKQLACATVLLTKKADKETLENYRFAYEN